MKALQIVGFAALFIFLFCMYRALFIVETKELATITLGIGESFAFLGIISMFLGNRKVKTAI